MNILLILGGIVLIVGGWFASITRNWNAPDGKARGPLGAVLLGVACLIVGIVRSF